MNFIEQNVNLIDVYILTISSIKDNEKFILSKFETNQIEILKKISNRERYLSKLGSLYLINKYTSSNPIYYNEFGRPYKENEFFNVSHSGEYIVFVKCDTEIGIDIELVRDLKKSLIDAIFSEEDKKHLQEKDDYIKAWTLKEGLLKCIGTGIEYSKLKNVPVYPIRERQYKGKKFYSALEKIDNYFLCITTLKENFKINLIKEKID